MLLFVLLSCKSTVEKCEVCTTTSNKQANISFDGFASSQKTNVNVWFANDVKEYYDYADLVNDKAFNFIEFQLNFENKFNCKLNDNSVIVAYAVYIDKQLHLDTSIKPENILAISIYSFNNKYLQHNFFFKNDSNKYLEIAELKSDVNGIEINAIHTLMKKIVAPKSPATSLLVTNFAAVSALGKTKKTPDNFKHKIKKYIQSLNSNSLTTNSELRDFADDEALCLSPCAIRGRTSCFRSDAGGYICRGIICPLQMAFNEVDTADYWSNTDSLSVTVKPSVAYQFKDSVLSKNEMGEKYITDYYFLGEAFSNSYNLTNSLKILRIMPKIYSIINKINSDNQTQITYDITTRDNIIGLINYFKTLTDDAIALSKMNSIIADVSYYCNQPVSLLRAALIN